MKEEDLCPVTKKFCPLHDIGSNKRHWCDNQGDPEEYEICPIPKKAAEALSLLQNREV